ncbi:MAG: nuclear transport factor 2 family protein [Pyrinomonadaceae bacterium]|nr:nuclear transport factor 2 family protein [Pyrinomonadaceae bacterium]
MNFKPILSMAIGLFLTTTIALALNNLDLRASGDNTEAIEKEVLRLEEVGRLKALKGDNQWDDLIAEGAYMIAYDGSIINYQKGQQFPPLPMKSFNMSEMIARVYGDVVVVTGLAEVEGETAEKKPFSFKMRFLNVWKKSGDGWKIVVSERTGVRPPPAK